ncbi:MAG: tRNA (adenosine(37)-N6)-threonylcarbamoyltransferase complex dimerization subunit type 1 TsaB [Muribaculaceae bacterium]|nr:tRNA (adenosine(37)-N6)-threonylcarbamoyltransferase complex dimerization subunit type 1 TsaB [Muribaculaceae bacterium]
MATILNIETSSSVCSVALTSDGTVLEHHENSDGQQHAVLLAPYVESLLKYVRTRELTLDAVAVSVGPGSYTGLRIGLSHAKGLAYGLKVPLIGVPTLKLIAVQAMFAHFFEDDDVVLVPMIDARRMEVYTAAYDMALNPVMDAQAMIIDEHSLDALLEQHDRVVLAGDGAEKAMNVIKHPRAMFIGGIKPVAVDMMALAEKAYREGQFIDVAYSTPLYLKEYQAGKPSKKVLQ